MARWVIRAADREHPADAVLRTELKAQRRMSPEEAGQVSRAVFAYYRWRGWLEDGAGGDVSIERALSLAERYARKPQSFSDAELVAHAVPDWLREEMEITPAWVRALQVEPKLWLRARPGQGRGLAEKLGDCRAFGEGSLAEILEYQGKKDLFRTPEFHAGEFELQDISSQAVGIMCGARPGETWWDACAGEGGKTLHLADLMENKGLIWASDRAGWRLQRLKRRAARARIFNYRSAPWDGRPKLPTKTKFDGVLIDAPCSGIGTWHRNPHARWTATPLDLKELSVLQQQLLANAAAAVKPGGKLIYAVCTLARSETTVVAESFRQQRPEFEPVAVRNPLAPGAPALAEIYLLPQEFSGNGMFIAAWRRPQAG
ncbi:MAG TPA: RsmB/NOP family class I SAM-dependent RNA methyltransferase [Candidatus Acidoferrum sp.]|nr:RsmB/NOP family class I SAM-dependent RNA methyltransferase [Candidatus Acidoferrum sp.]